MKENKILLLFFLPYMFIVSIAFMNLVTAVIVEKAITSGVEERDMRYQREKKLKEKQADDLREMFATMDEDGDSVLRLEELMRCPCLLYTSPSPRDLSTSRMPSSA